MLRLLETKKQQLAANSVLTQKQLLKVSPLFFSSFYLNVSQEFLQHLKKQKDEQLFALQKEASVIQVNLGCTSHFLIHTFQTDLDYVDSVLRQLEKRPGSR